jgi:hypothetical protein
VRKQELHFHRDMINGPDAHVANVILPYLGELGRRIVAGHRVICTSTNSHERWRRRDGRGMGSHDAPGFVDVVGMSALGSHIRRSRDLLPGGPRSRSAVGSRQPSHQGRWYGARVP